MKNFMYFILFSVLTFVSNFSISRSSLESSSKDDAVEVIMNGSINTVRNLGNKSLFYESELGDKDDGYIYFSLFYESELGDKDDGFIYFRANVTG